MKKLVIVIAIAVVALMIFTAYRGHRSEMTAPAWSQSQPADTVAEQLYSYYGGDSTDLVNVVNSRGETVVFKVVEEVMRGEQTGETEPTGSMFVTCNGDELRLVNDAPYDGDVLLLGESRFQGLLYFLSPDERYLFLVPQLLTAGSCDINYKVHVYCVDVETRGVHCVVNCGGVRVTPTGFTAATQVERVGGTSCADYRYTLRNEYYDYAGNLVSHGKVENDEKLVKEYACIAVDAYGEVKRLEVGQSCTVYVE